MNRRSILTWTTAVLLALPAGGLAQADETFKSREIVHATSAQSQEIGNLDGHSASLIRFSGLALLQTVQSEPFISLRLPTT
jgi:hypothetical protein